jgi:hypothetical protein
MLCALPELPFLHPKSKNYTQVVILAKDPRKRAMEEGNKVIGGRFKSQHSGCADVFF